MAIAAAPALVLGPPGWAIFAVAVLGTVAASGVVEPLRLPKFFDKSRSKTKERAKTQEIVETCRNSPKRPWTIRIQMQGKDIGGTTGSTAQTGANTVAKKHEPVSVTEGLNLLEQVYQRLGKRQKRERSDAKDKCHKYIINARVQGGMPPGAKKSFPAGQDGIRVDIESYGPSPNFIL